MRRIPSMSLLIALLVSAAACASGDPGPVATGPTAETTTPGPTDASGSPPASPSISPPAGATLEDGRHFGFVRSVDVDGLAIGFDDAEFLGGDEANEAAAEDGLETPVPNDYYIENEDRSVQALGIAPDLRLDLLDWNHCCDRTFVGELGTFASAVNGGEVVNDGDLMYYGSLSQYWVTVRDGVVTGIEEQYLP